MIKPIIIAAFSLFILPGCTTSSLNRSLGTPKNPTAVFVDAARDQTLEARFLRADYNLLLTAIDTNGATISAPVSPTAARAYIEAGFNLGDAYCDRFLNKTVESAQRRRYGRALTNDIGTGSNALLSVFGAGKDVIAAFAAAFGSADSAWRNYDEAFLISPELSNVHVLLRSAQGNFRERTLGKNATLPTTYSGAQTAIRDYARYCTNLGMRALINQSATEKASEIAKDTEKTRNPGVGINLPAPAPASPAAPAPVG